MEVTVLVGKGAITPSVYMAGVLIDLFLHSEKGWGAPPHSQSKKVQPLSQTAFFTYSYSSNPPYLHREMRLVHHDRPRYWGIDPPTEVGSDEDKSCLTPSRSVTYLWLVLDSASIKACLTQQGLKVLRAHSSQFMSRMSSDCEV